MRRCQQQAAMQQLYFLINKLLDSHISQATSSAKGTPVAQASWQAVASFLQLLLLLCLPHQLRS
jgi:hypothetical protein